MTDDRQKLTIWEPDPSAMSLQNLDTWHVGGGIHRLPAKSDLREQGVATLLSGWLPAAPLISATTRVIGLGSCFARYFVLWLAEHGFNTTLDSSPHNALIQFASDFQSPAVIAQQFRWAFNELSGDELLWIAKNKDVFEATDERRQLVRRTLEHCDVLIITLGLSEVWYDNRTGEPLWRALTERHYDASRHVFRTERMQDTREHLEKIEAIRRRWLPHLKMVYTVSPVRLAATFRPISAITANSASKAILRAALDEFLRDHADLVNRDLFYFPAYEIVHDYFRDPFEDDNRHIVPFVASEVVRAFADHYCAPDVLARAREASEPTGSELLDTFLTFSATRQNASKDEALARIAELEERVASLQNTCDDRLRVIEVLDKAARERLALVERLHAECAQLQAQAAQRR